MNDNDQFGKNLKHTGRQLHADGSAFALSPSTVPGYGRRRKDPEEMLVWCLRVQSTTPTLQGQDISINNQYKSTEVVMPSGRWQEISPLPSPPITIRFDWHRRMPISTVYCTALFLSQLCPITPPLPHSVLEMVLDFGWCPSNAVLSYLTLPQMTVTSATV